MSFGYKTNIDGVVLKKVIKFQNNVSAKHIFKNKNILVSTLLISQTTAGA
jgi:hypothetical protein